MILTILFILTGLTILIDLTALTIMYINNQRLMEDIKKYMEEIEVL